MKDTALNIFRKLSVENDSSKYWGFSLVTEQGTQTCIHQIFKMKRCKQNSSLQDLTSLGISFPVFISDSLCQYYKILWWKCKKILTNKIIDSFWVSNGSIRLSVEDRPWVIKHISDLEDLFPGNDLLRDKEQITC